MPTPTNLTGHNEPYIAIKVLRGALHAGSVRTGRPVAALAAELGISPSILLDPLARIPHAQMSDAWTRLADLCDEPCFGLFAMSSLGVAQFDMVDCALVLQPSVQRLWDSFTRYQSLVHDANACYLAKEGEREESPRVAWVQRFLPDLPTSRHLVEFLLGGWFTRLTRATERKLPLLKVEFRHRPPAASDQSLYKKIFGDDVTIVFEAPRNALVYEASVMELPLVAADPKMQEMYARQLEQALVSGARVKAESDPHAFIDKVRVALVKLLPDGNADADRLAAAMEMSTRTLHRRLADLGFAFRELLDEVRSSMAKTQLSQGTMTLTDLAFLLGYADHTAFTRAFRRWTGQSPTEFRRGPSSSSSSSSPQTTLRLRSSAVVFQVGDVDATMRWYETHLGFVGHRFPEGEPSAAFGILSRDAVEIMLQRVPDAEALDDTYRRRSGGCWHAYLRIDGVHALDAELQKRAGDITIVEPLKKQPYGDTEVVVKDLNGYVLVFSELVPS